MGRGGEEWRDRGRDNLLPLAKIPAGAHAPIVINI